MSTHTKKKKTKKKRELYFNADTHAAIVEHQKTDDIKKRERIFVSRIHPAFNKLVENLINMHRFTGQYDSHGDLKSDCITFLYESMHKFDPDRGTNAFSYFNIVAKHWLIVRSKKRVKNQQRNVSINDSESLTLEDMEIIDSHHIVPAQDEVIDRDVVLNEILSVLELIRRDLKTQNELLCIDAIMTVFRVSDELDFLNKTAVLTYIREISGLTPKQMTMSMYSIKKLYREIRADDGLLDVFDSDW